MKKDSPQLDINSLLPMLRQALSKVNGYRVFIFFLAASALYGYIVWRINVYSNAAPSASEISAQTSAQPHIDPTTVQKIQNLQDNSVSVQSLFDAARQNPFQE
jgi:hypothetical protein